MADVKVGFLLWPQTASWPALRDAAVRAERAGAASLWTWDHLMSIVGPWQGPILEGWSVLSGWAAVTERATLGLMVGANTFRNPGLTAKLATTLDHRRTAARSSASAAPGSSASTTLTGSTSGAGSASGWTGSTSPSG